MLGRSDDGTANEFRQTNSGNKLIFHKLMATTQLFLHFSTLFALVQELGPAVIKIAQNVADGSHTSHTD